MLESGPTRSLVAKLSQRSSLAVREFCAATKDATNEAMDGYVQNLDDVAPKAHQNDRNCLRELSGATFD